MKALLSRTDHGITKDQFIQDVKSVTALEAALTILTLMLGFYIFNSIFVIVIGSFVAIAGAFVYNLSKLPRISALGVTLMALFSGVSIGSLVSFGPRVGFMGTLSVSGTLLVLSLLDLKSKKALSFLTALVIFTVLFLSCLLPNVLYYKEAFNVYGTAVTIFISIFYLWITTTYLSFQINKNVYSADRVIDTSGGSFAIFFKILFYYFNRILGGDSKYPMGED